MGCAHQVALNLIVEGGHSPPYKKILDSSKREMQRYHADIGLPLYL
ncbi:hypothetical protein D1AOALGA4SA_845 [Olavius algarvensis Delta 1 endosymbiont]|nr:hypothetical protein D1AOALGA4SA_845 [Olavius algarvensis Delta 1 endosymbiont]